MRNSSGASISGRWPEPSIRNQLGAWDGFFVRPARADRYDCVLCAPDQKSGNACGAAQQVGKGGVVHVGPPTESHRLLPGDLPSLGELGGGGVGADCAELFRGEGVSDSELDVVGGRLHEHIEDFAFGGLDARAPDQDHLLEVVRAEGGYGCRKPAPKGQADDVGLPNPEVVEGLKVPVGHVPHGHYPVQAGRFAVAGVGGDGDLEMLRQGLLIAEPGVLPHLVVEDDEGRARAGLEDLEVGAGYGNDIFGVCGLWLES